MRVPRATAGLITAVTLVAVLTVAVALGDRAARVDPPALPVATPAVDRGDASSAAWYCAAGGGDVAATIRVTNLGDDEIDAVVSVLAGRDEEPAVLELAVEAQRTATVALVDLTTTPEPAAVVETFGGATFVEHELRHGDDVAFTPCATSAGTEWYFGAGSTAQGARQELVLFNPFGEDASVDIAFVTESGFAQPERLQGFTVPRRSRVAIPIHTEIGRADLVATHVGVRIGRVVAEQVLILDGSDTVGGREGLSVGPGASSPGEEWVFPWAGPVGGTDAGVVVANFGAESGELTVSIALDGEATLEDQTVPVPPRTVTYVDLAARVPGELGATVTLRTSPGVAVVADLIVSEGAGLAVMTGRTEGSTFWAFSGPGSRLAIFNPGNRAAEVEVRTASGDELAVVEVPGGERVELIRGDLEGADGPVVVEASAPVLVVRVGSLTVSPGIVGS